MGAHTNFCRGGTNLKKPPHKDIKTPTWRKSSKQAPHIAKKKILFSRGGPAGAHV